MAIYIEILEVGSNVVMSGTGTANTSSLTSGGTLSVGSVIYPSADNITLLSAGLTEVREWTGITGIFPDMGPGSFTQSFNRTGTYSLGIMENYLGDVTLYLDDAYVSGTEIGPTTATFNSTNFTTLGINPGTYTWSWGSGPTADSFTVQVGPLSPTPTPTETAAVTPTPTETPTPTPTETAAVTPTPTAEVTPTPTETAAVTPTPSVTETPSVTPTPTATTPVLPTPTPTATNPSLLISVDATYNPGSIWVTYVATSTGPVDSDVTITFDNTLGVIDGSPYVITASITIPSGQSTGTTTYYLPEGIYANLDFTSTFDNVTTTYTGGTFGFVVNTESVFDNETIAITANTEYIVCNVCGDTAIEINPPHPVWTGLYGETIIQANAVQLGGRNGLNS